MLGVKPVRWGKVPVHASAIGRWVVVASSDGSLWAASEHDDEAKARSFLAQLDDVDRHLDKFQRRK